jgi:glycerol-3-phosphate dehydrogenase
LERRDEVLQAVRQWDDVSVLIVGAGINGAGLFRELALQGIDVLLVDKSDFCAGASAAPSRMIHGGLRYLENGELRLVTESLRERNRLLENAPHYVRPLPTTIPIFHWFSGLRPAVGKLLGLQTGAHERSALLIKIGLTLYDLVVRHRLLPRHHFTSRRRALEGRPYLNRDIRCTATYYDAWISYPERLCLELIQDAEAVHPKAKALNHVSLVEGGHDHVVLRDEMLGETFTLRPHILVNATGAWIDVTHEALHFNTHLIGGTKGSHVMLDNAELLAAMQGEMLFYENADKRVCIMFPFMGKVLAGSTDIRVEHPEAAGTTEEDIEYLLNSVRQVFPQIPLRREDVVFHFCGVRPLPYQNADTTGKISRDHSIHVIEPDANNAYLIMALIGGKWTTFRAFAEQAANQILPRLGVTRRLQSHNLPIGGGKQFPAAPAAREAWLERLHHKTGLSESRLTALLDRYGTQGERIADFLLAAPDSPLQHYPAYTRREIEYLILHERVTRLDDLVLRRTLFALLGELTAPLLYELADIAALVCGWSDAAKREEIERLQTLLEIRHGVHRFDTQGAD